MRIKSLMPEKSKGNNYTSKINVFLLAGHKVYFFPPARQTIVYFSPREKTVYFASVKFDAQAKRGQQLHE